MVRLDIVNLPKLSQEEIERLFSDLLCALMDQAPITRVYSEKDELIHFPPDQMEYGLGKEILAEVTGLPVINLTRKESEIERRKALGNSIRQVLVNHFPQANVECKVYPPNPDIIVCNGD